MRLALIRNNEVINIIVADVEFAQSLISMGIADLFVDVSNRSVDIGWLYDPQTDTFINPSEQQ